MKDMMALAAERAAKVLSKVLPDASKNEEQENADALDTRASSNAGGKKEQNRG